MRNDEMIRSFKKSLRFAAKQYEPTRNNGYFISCALRHADSKFKLNAAATTEENHNWFIALDEFFGA